MASNEDKIPDDLNKEQQSEKEAEKIDASDDGSIAPSEPGGAAPSHALMCSDKQPDHIPSSKTAAATSSELDPPEYTPVAWARHIVNLVKNPPGNRPRESYMLESDDSLSMPEDLSVPELSPVKQTKRPPSSTARSLPATNATKKHARPVSFAPLSSSSEDFSISGSESEHEDSPLVKKLRREDYSFQEVPLWDSLLLGRRLGSVALNKFLEKVDPPSPQLTSLQTYQLVNSLQLETVMPPEGSVLNKVIQTSRLENETLYDLNKDDNVVNFGIPHFKMLARLYENMASQNIEPLRQEIQQLAPLELVDRITSMEQSVASLYEREESLMKTANDLDIVNNKEICKQLGFRTPLEKYNSRPPPPPPPQALQPRSTAKQVHQPMVATAIGGLLIPASKAVAKPVVAKPVTAPTQATANSMQSSPSTERTLTTPASNQPPAASPQPAVASAKHPKTSTVTETVNTHQPDKA